MLWPQAHRLEQLASRRSLHNHRDVPHMPAQLSWQRVQGFGNELFELLTPHRRPPRHHSRAASGALDVPTAFVAHG
jgi:hypothetical protein